MGNRWNFRLSLYRYVILGSTLFMEERQCKPHLIKTVCGQHFNWKLIHGFKFTPVMILIIIGVNVGVGASIYMSLLELRQLWVSEWNGRSDTFASDTSDHCHCNDKWQNDQNRDTTVCTEEKWHLLLCCLSSPAAHSDNTCCCWGLQLWHSLHCGYYPNLGTIKGNNLPE